MPDGLCYACGKTFSHKKNLYTHMRKTHSIEPIDKQVKCSNCGKKFKDNDSMKRHRRKIHLIGAKPTNHGLKCDKCNSYLATKSSLNRHQQIVHGALPYRKNQRGIICTECNDYSSHRMEDLRTHLENYHEISLEKDELRFERMADFKEWKNEMEAAERCSFVRLNRLYKLITGEKHLIFSCHRSGRRKQCSSAKQADWDSVKIGRTCPSSLSVIEMKDGKILVTHHKTHLGHDCHLRSLNLTKKLRTMRGDRIVNDVRDPVTLMKEKKFSEKDEIQQNMLKCFHNIPKDMEEDDDYQAALRHKCNIVQDMITDVHPDDAKELIKHLDQLIAIFCKKISARGRDHEVSIPMSMSLERRNHPKTLSIKSQKILETVKHNRASPDRRLTQSTYLKLIDVKQKSFDESSIYYINLDHDYS